MTTHFEQHANQKRLPLIAIVAGTFLLMGCSPGANEEAAADGAAHSAATSSGQVPTDLDALFTYLTNKEYEGFAERETAAHPSRGPHARFSSPVRVFMNDVVAASLAQGNTSHPKGSEIVKEMYLDDGETLEGWAVMVKTQEDSDEGNGWFWYEVTSTTDSTALGGGEAGNGVKLCTSCHVSGNDYVLSKYPLE